MRAFSLKVNCAQAIAEIRDVTDDAAYKVRYLAGLETCFALPHSNDAWRIFLS